MYRTARRFVLLLGTVMGLAAATAAPAAAGISLGNHARPAGGSVG